LQLYTWNKPCFLSVQCYSYPLLTVYGTGKAIAHDRRFVFLYEYFRKYVCSAPYGCFL
jgi:hypothetical protein